MIQEEILAKNRAGVFPAQDVDKKQKQIRIFVPVNFSTCSYNALEYALKLAKACHGSIDLFHVADADALPESENILVIARMLSRLETKMTRQVTSLKEMISESGITVSSCKSTVGNVYNAILQRIQQLSPDLVILGRNNSTGHIVSSMLRSMQCPLLIVPETTLPCVPVNIVLSSDRKPVTLKALAPLFRIIQNSTPKLSVLNVRSGKRGEVHCARFNVPVNGHTVQVQYAQHENVHVVNGINTFVRDNKTDLLCTIYRTRFSLRNLFRRNHAEEIIQRIDIPVLLLQEEATG